MWFLLKIYLYSILVQENVHGMPMLMETGTVLSRSMSASPRARSHCTWPRKASSIVWYLLICNPYSILNYGFQKAWVDPQILQWVLHSSDLHSMVCTYVLGKAGSRKVWFNFGRNHCHIEKIDVLSRITIFQDLVKEAAFSERMVKQTLENLDTLLLSKTYLVIENSC